MQIGIMWIDFIQIVVMLIVIIWIVIKEIGIM